MNNLGIEHFVQFFRELHDGKAPFPWQQRLATRVLEKGWPEVVDLPTASGKTACIDIALFALACRPNSPRRIFFVVDRRVVVNEAYDRMQALRKRLASAQSGVLGEVAARFRRLSGDPEADPLSVYELRGAIYRDESWVRSPRQPTVIASTVDQVGSRLLFRGYGVSDSLLPIHAGLIGNDALIILDEAHCSKAFAQTLARIQVYRGERWATEPLTNPFASVEMTATPARPNAETPFGLDANDRAPDRLGKRLRAKKPTRLVSVKGRADEREKLVKALFETGLDLAASYPEVRRIAIMTNRVASAGATHKLLTDTGKRATLVIGRMRPIDRDDLNNELYPLKAGEKRGGLASPWFVVSTQCLEAGADLDFDALITECASIDALLQRFGRLDRLGDFGSAVGRVVALTGESDGKQPDAVYEEALSNTWKWLSKLAEARGGELNFGIEAEEGDPGTVAQAWKELAPKDRASLSLQLPSAPMLLPAHLDALVQTSPKPAAEPSVDLFLHGPQRGNSDIQVIFRGDLDLDRQQDWQEIVAACPPVSAEALPVPIGAFMRWLKGGQEPIEQADLEGISEDQYERPPATLKRILIWRGDESTTDPRFVRPGDTVIAPAEYGNVGLGHVLDQGRLDCGDRAFLKARAKIRLRLHPRLISQWPESPGREGIKKVLEAEELLWPDLQDAVRAYTPPDEPRWEWLRQAINEAARSSVRMFRQTWYPGNVKALVLEGRRRRASSGQLEADGESDERSEGPPVALEVHLNDVRNQVASLKPLVSDKLMEVLARAAQWHDFGKADIRFQILLNGGDVLAAKFAPSKLAKGRFLPGGSRERWERSGLPKGFRHELISLAMVCGEPIPSGERDLVLHLIASHHGRCRPFAPCVLDESAQDVSFGSITLSVADSAARAAHRLDSEVADRFWALTRRFGWWGLAYLESMLRLSDWTASEMASDAKGAVA